MTTDGSRPTELELKYRVGDLAAAERLLTTDRLGPFAPTGSGPRSTQLEDRYVDTPDGSLQRAGFAVRLRMSGGETIVSVKSLSRTEGPGGSVRREELEGPADRVAAPIEWPSSDARALVLEHAGDSPLVERVTVRQLRRKRLLRSSAARVELSLDEVDVVARGRVVERFVELEAELMKGDETELEALGRTLDAEPALRRAVTSKLEAALAAVDGASDDEELPAEPVETSPETSEGTRVREPARRETSRLVVGKTPGVAADDHIGEAGRKVMRFHLARMLDHEPGVRAGIDTEDVHKMRVATRRQRAAWRVFGEAYRPRRTRRYRSGLQETARRLGAVRDLDVQLEAADAYREPQTVTEQRAMEPLLGSWRQHRDDARVLLLRELDSPAYRRWLDDYIDFVRTDGAAVLPVGPTQPHRVRDTAPSRIWAAYEQVRAYESVLRWADVETLHELRIAGKWLRYSLEFVREALGPESDPLIERVTALQDHLGLMNDADVTASMTRTFLGEHAGDLSPLESAAIGRYLVDREREIARLRRTIGATWRGVSGATFRRRLGRVVASL
jgi:CHAD domain-containing protein